MGKLVPKKQQETVVGMAGGNTLAEMQNLQKAVATPTPEDGPTAAEMAEAADAERRARGRASTILTGSGLLSDPSVSRRTLMGI